MSSVSLLEPKAAASSQVLRDLWLNVLRKLEPHVPRGQFITWFKDTTVLGRDQGTLVVGLSLPMFLDWHISHYRASTLRAAQEVDPSIQQVVYKVDVGLKDDRARTVDVLAHFPEPKKRKLPGRQEVKIAEGIISKILSPRYTLENFVVGSNTRLAYAACQAVAAQPGGKYNPLFLYGGVGLGKTHLLHATGNAILHKDPRRTVMYTTSEEFTNQVVEAIQHQKMDQLRRRYRVVDVLIIDDIQFLANKERTQEEFFHTFNTLYEERKQIIISGDRPPQELLLEDRLRSRFERGMIADVSAPDYETRLAILLSKAQEYELMLDMNVLQFIAEHATKNIRELEGILMQAIAQYELEQRVPTVKSIAEIMCKLNKDPHAEPEVIGFETLPKQKATFQQVLEAVSRYYSVSVQDMMGSSRVREILQPRQIAMYLGKKHLRLTHVKLGEIFSNRDHTTVMNAVEKIERVMLSDAQILREVRSLEKELELVQ
jgi:chromosomal replication initiator protein